jgi:hypothetical protein
MHVCLYNLTVWFHKHFCTMDDAAILMRIKGTLPLLQDIIDACQERATYRGA